MKKMSIKELIHDLKALAENFAEETGGSVPSCLPQTIELLEQMSMTELEKLKKWLDENGYESHWNTMLTENDQVIVFENGHRSWDAICTRHSYGGEQGLLEIYGSICEPDAIGWLRAEDIIRLLQGGKKNDQSGKR